jgi:hypothetical protein
MIYKFKLFATFMSFALNSTNVMMYILVIMLGVWNMCSYTTYFTSVDIDRRMNWQSELILYFDGELTTIHDNG